MWIMEYTNISLLDLSCVSSTQLCHILHGFRFKYYCYLLINYKTSYSFQHAGMSYAVITIDAILEGWIYFAVSLTNKVIGSDVKINQDSTDGYEGLGFDMSTFNEDGSGDVYTIGISMPVRMVQCWEREYLYVTSCPSDPTWVSFQQVHPKAVQATSKYLVAVKSAFYFISTSNSKIMRCG